MANDNANDVLRDLARPDDYLAALKEAETLVGLLMGLPCSASEREQAAALRARGWPLFDIDGETALPEGVRCLNPRLAREYVRLQTLVHAVVTPEVLAAYLARRALGKAQRGAQSLQRYIAQAAELLDAMADGEHAGPALAERAAAIERAVMPWLAAAKTAAELVELGRQADNESKEK